MQRTSKSTLGSAVPTATIALPAVALFAYGLRFHEPWRDEVQALLIGRDVPLSGLLHAMRLEGAPPLYHLLLGHLCFVLPAPTALALAAALGYAALLAGTLHLLIVLSRRPRASAAVTLALAFTNTYVYELGVISRPYGLGLGLNLAGIAELLVAHKLRRPRRALRGALLCGLAALTSAHAACVAGAALASFALTEIVIRRSVRPALPTLVSLPFLALTSYVIAPFAERTPESATASNPLLTNAFSQAVVHLEWGTFAGGWWRDGGVQWPPDWPVFRVFTTALAIIAVVRIQRRRRDRAADHFVLGVVLLSWATLLYIFVAWYSGAYRHHLHLWIPALVVALGWLLDARFARGRAALALGAAAVLLVPWAGYQYHMAWDDLVGDLRGEFTQTKSAAAMLPKDAHVVADDDCAVLGLRLWRGDITLRSSKSLGRRFEYLVYDRDWNARVPLAPLVAEECRAAPDRTMLARHHLPADGLSPCLTLVQSRHGLNLSERFNLFRVDCDCVAR